ncbi:ABC transporter ATP-binding protein [Streptomyces noursei]|uniref:ABC transporter ATP-binding protein n=1 Tax=Streptomyces noursei TaxID=1971 RepID=UPI0022A7AFEB|nr:ABC transporter ATP-binding protein [Streptomyces noursei]MCZ1015924.1 ABC transporter ATP-binding protein [Streptomyces noursei]
MAGTDTARQGWARRLTRDCSRYRKDVVLALGASLAGMVVLAFVPLIPKLIIDDVIVRHERALAPWATLLIVAAVVVYALTYLRRFYGGRLALDVQHDLRTRMFDAIARLDGRRQDELSTGQVVGRATSDLQLIQSLLFMLPMVIGSILLFVISLAVMAILSPLLTVIVLAVAPALWFIARRSRTRLFPATWYAQGQAAEVASVVDGAVSGVRVVKGFGQEEQETGKLREVGRRLFAARLRTVRLNSRYTPALQAVPSLGQVAMLALGGWMATQGHITLGTFVAFSTYLAQLVGPVRMLAMMLTVGQQARAGVERVYELIDTEPTIEEHPDAHTLPADAPATVVFDRVTFGYGPHHAPAGDEAAGGAAGDAAPDEEPARGPVRPVLDAFSLRIDAGETVAVIGTSGSGKSTVSLLLPRFYDVTAGRVLVGGHDVRDLTLESLRAAIGLVPESSFLFSDSIRDNIAYGHPEATDEQIRAAARAAQADRFISELPQGYDTKVGEQGLTLSGGQRQRVALARAILTDPRLLVLDDATSAVDVRVEHEIHEALRGVMAGRTTLLIAHRASTLALADRVAVLDGGRLVDLGTQEELAERCALYRRLLTDPEELGGVPRDPAGELAGWDGPRAGSPPLGRSGTWGRSRERGALRRRVRRVRDHRPADAGPGRRPAAPRRRRPAPPRSPGRRRPGRARRPHPRHRRHRRHHPRAVGPPRAGGRAGRGRHRRPRRHRRRPRHRRRGGRQPGHPRTPRPGRRAAAGHRHPGRRRGRRRPRRALLRPAPAAARLRPAARPGPAAGRRGRGRLAAAAGPHPAGHRRRRPARHPGRRLDRRRARAGRGRRPVGRPDRRQPHDRPHRRTGPVLPPPEDLRPAPAPRSGLLRARADRQDHDPDDHRRGRAVHVPPDRPGHRRRLGAHLLRHPARPARPRRPAGPGRLRHPPPAGPRHVRLPQAQRPGVRAGPRADQHRQRRPPGEHRRTADRPGVPPRGARRRAVRRAQRRLPTGPGTRPVPDIRLLPVRPAAVVGGVRPGPDRRRRPDRWAHPHRRRAGRLPPLHRPVLRPRPAALPGLRRLPAGHRLARPDPRTPRPAHVHPGRRAAPPGHRAARRPRLRRRALSLRRPRRAGPGRHRPHHPRRADRRLRRRDRRRQVHPRQARRPLLRPDLRRGPDRRHRPARVGPDRLPPPARRRPPGVLPLPRHGPRRHRLRPPGRQRRRGGGRRPGRRRARHDRHPRRRLPPRGRRARPQPLRRPAPAARPGPGRTHRPRRAVARRGHRRPGPGHRGRRQPGHRPPRRPPCRPPVTRPPPLIERSRAHCPSLHGGLRRPHHLDRRPPPQHGRPRRPGGGARPRPDHRGRHTRPTPRP